jgi:hypothetical protein
MHELDLAASANPKGQAGEAGGGRSNVRDFFST